MCLHRFIDGAWSQEGVALPVKQRSSKGKKAQQKIEGWIPE